MLHALWLPEITIRQRQLVQLVIRTNGRHSPSGRQFPAILEGSKGCFASGNDSRIVAKFVPLPNNFQFHFRRRITADLLDMTDRQLALGPEPLRICTGGSKFTYNLDRRGALLPSE